MGLLPEQFENWFEAKGWQAHPHQLELLQRADDPSVLLIAPTGGGKTLAGFLPSLVDLAKAPHTGLHTLYISPLKALAADIRRNLGAPVAELGLDIRIEDRTGDTKAGAKKRQRVDPPHILLTTPESLALLLSYEDAPRIFAGLKRIIVDEIHALAESKRGDQLMLGLSRLTGLAPSAVRVGLSATVEDPPALGEFLAPDEDGTHVLVADPGPPPDIDMLVTDEPPPWAGNVALYSAPAVMAEIRKAKTTLVFVNTRATAELYFQALWALNDENLPIGLHHGSLSREAREKVEAAMAAGTLRGVVCTASLDLGIDWGDVDSVIQVGAPKNVKRLVQRIGRSNHRYNAPSRARLVPANRMEVVECLAALEAAREGDLDGEPRGAGPLDVLCQHILLIACAGAFDADALFDEVRRAGPYRALERAAFDRCLEYCATGGYALKAYDRWQRLMQGADGRWSLRDPRSAGRLRMNVGTIVDTETLGVRMRGRGAKLGEVEENFAASLVAGDTFLIGGQVVRYDGLREMTVVVSPSGGKDPKIAVFSGTKLAASTRLMERVLDILNAPERWTDLPDHTSDWLRLQAQVSQFPTMDRLMVETFWRGERAFACIHGFAGKNAMQTLGLLITRRMEVAGLEPLGFVSTDYALLIWGLQEITEPGGLFNIEGLREDLESWLAENAVMKRTFKNAATVALMIERAMPGLRKSGRQATFSTDIIYDTLRKYDPGHLMMEITRAEAERGLVDFGRIEALLARVGGKIDIVRAKQLTPLAAPLLLEVGKVPIQGLAQERLLEEEAARMMADAGLAGG